MSGALSDLVAFGALALVCAGVYILWGPGWTCIAAGAPFLVLYLWREIAFARRMRRS